MKKQKIKNLAQCLFLPLLTGGLAAFFTNDSMKKFEEMMKPPLTPPGYLFPIVWTGLYILMGIASYLVFTADAKGDDKEKALRLYGLQLAVNFLWPILFFRFSLYLFAFFWILLLWGMILVIIVMFNQINRAAAYLMMPYLLWVTFAGYLNFAIYLLNKV